MTRYEIKRLSGFAAQGPACAVLLAKFLAERRRPKPSFRKAKKAIKRWARAASVAEIRATCVRRASYVCECGCGAEMHDGVGPRKQEWDEFFGRRNVSVQTTWMISAQCHVLKSQNFPTREHWDMLFRRHCERYGYEFRPRLTKDIQVRHRRQRSPENPPSPLVAPSGLIKEHT